MTKDCIEYAKSCQACQKFGDLRHVPAENLHSVIKPWPFRGWALDLIGKVSPPSLKQHCFIIVAIDYFTKWVEAKPMKTVDQYDVIIFIKDLMCWFGIPQSITMDNGTVFDSTLVREFVDKYKVPLIHSTLIMPSPMAK